MNREERNRYHREARRWREYRLRYDPELATHGKATTYSNWRCRCPECKAAWAAATRERRNR